MSETPYALDRRSVLIASLAGAASAALPDRAAAQAAGPNADHGPAETLRERCTAFLAALTPEQRARAAFPWDGPAWRDWNYFFQDTTRFIKPGLRLEEMSEPQKDLAWDAASAVLSVRGLDKARLIMLQQAFLASQNRGRDERHPERFSFAVHGEPAPRGSWGFRLIGHHLTISFVVADDRIVATTPTGFASHPNRMLGARRAMTALVAEDALARRLVAELTGPVRRAVVLGSEPIWDVLTTPGREGTLTRREGLPIGELAAGHQDMAREVVEAFLLEHLPEPYAERVRARYGPEIASAHLMAAGGPALGKPLYYRIHGARFLIEYASVDDEAQHLHTIVHAA